MQDSSEIQPLWVPADLTSLSSLSAAPASPRDGAAQAPAGGASAADAPEYVSRWTEIYPVGADAACNAAANKSKGKSGEAPCPQRYASPRLAVRDALAPWLAKAESGGLFSVRLGSGAQVRLGHSANCWVSRLVYLQVWFPKRAAVVMIWPAHAGC
jgi:hypothetical protein